MTLLAVEDVTKRYGERDLLRGVSLQIAAGERLAIVGDNGAGKSTLLRILAGDEVPDAGRRTARRDIRVGYLAQDPVVDASRTIRDEVRAGLTEWLQAHAELDATHHAMAEPNLSAEQLERLLRRQSAQEERVLALGGHDREHEVEATIAALGLPEPDASCAKLSGGERRRVALARLLLTEPDVLLLDEPTNHLDAYAIEWLEDHLLQTRATLVLVTHDRYFLDRVVQRIVEVDRGRLHAYDGAYQDFLQLRAERLMREEKAESSRLNLLRRETAWMRRGPPARTTKAKARIARYGQIVAAEREAPDAGIEFVIPCSTRLGDRVLRLTGVTKAYGERTVIAPLDLEIGPGTRLGIVGRNGAGKTTLLRLCTGALAPDAGTVQIGPTVRFAQIDQGRTDLDPTKTVLEEVGRDYDHVSVDGRMVRVETFLEQFGFLGGRKQTRIGDLSGGERNRVLLAKLLSIGGNVLVLDEPTNDLDLSTLRVLEEALCAFAGAVLIVSHDRWFLDRVATRIVALDGEGHALVHEGDLSSFLARHGGSLSGTVTNRGVEGSPTAPPVVESTPAAAPAPSPAPPRRKLSTREHDELQALPARIAEAEAAVKSLDDRLADPKLYVTPGADPIALSRERDAAAKRLDALLARWVELEERA